MHTMLPFENGNALLAIQNFLRKLLESGVIDLLLVPMRAPNGAVTPALVSDPAQLKQADPLAPVMSNNTATLVGKLSYKEPRPRLGAVLRACELRALVELVKMQQASLESLTLIAIDCPGTYNVSNFMKIDQNVRDHVWRELYEGIENNPPVNLRSACQICEQPVYPGAQISIELFGSDLATGIHLSLSPELAQQLGLAEKISESFASKREEALRELIAARTARQEAEFPAIRARLEGNEGIQGVFAACIRCHNCMTVCPICYCKTCVFKSAVFDHEPMQYATWARQKGAYRLPSDTLLFHLTRMNHMALSCVGCGMCTEACPAELPVGLVFRAISQRLQATFDYAPGRDLEEPLPLITFKADEWTEVGE